MNTPRLRCKRCSAFVSAPTPVLVTEPVVRSRLTRAYDALIALAATAGLSDLAVRGAMLVHAALRAHGICP